MDKNDKILVTGSAGFMGSHLIDHLEARGYDVVGIDNLSGGYLRNVRNKNKFTKLDLRDRAATGVYIDKLRPNVIFHLAADATEGRSHFTPFSALDNNFAGYLNLLVPAIRNNLKHMVLTSSMSVYGAQPVPFTEDMMPMPEDTYAVSKSAMESVTRIKSNVFGFTYTIIRPHNVFGPHQNIADPYRNVIGIFLNRLLNDQHFYIYGDGKQIRAFSYISDVIPPMIRAAKDSKCHGRIINIGGETPITIKELAQIVLEEFHGTNVAPAHHEPKHLPDRPQEVKEAYSDHSVARELIGFEPKISIREGLREMIGWAKEIGHQPFTYLDALDLEHESLPDTWRSKLL